MLTVRVHQFEGYGLNEFTSFLEENDDNTFEIIIPKETILFYSTNNDIAWEFAIAAYIGQKLNEISSKFSYSAASLSELDEFNYQIKTINVDALAELLLEISSAFGNSELIEPIDFASEVSAFLDDFRDKKVVCQDLFDTAYEYHSDDIDNDE